MAWIRVDSELKRSRECLMIRRSTGQSALLIQGALCEIWIYLDEVGRMDCGAERGGRNPFNNKDAILEDTAIELLKVALPEGCGPIVDGMVQVGWIVEEGDDLRFPSIGRRGPTKGLRRGRESWAKSLGSSGGRMSKVSGTLNGTLEGTLNDTLSGTLSESVDLRQRRQ